MFRRSLLAATALVLCASITFAGPRTGRTGDSNSLRDRKPNLPVRLDRPIPAVVAIGKAGVPVRNNVSHYEIKAVFNNFSKDANAEFISWYGFNAFYSTNSASGCGYSPSYTCFFYSASNAVPMTGTGARVTRLKVPLFSLTGSKTAFNVGLYSATASGLPGNQELAGGSTTASDTRYCCTAVRTVKVDITLKAGQKYFLKVSCRSNPCSGGWDMENIDFSGDAQDYFRYKSREWCYCSGRSWSSTKSSPWHLSTEFPEQPAAIVK